MQISLCANWCPADKELVFIIKSIHFPSVIISAIFSAAELLNAKTKTT